MKFSMFRFIFGIIFLFSNTLVADGPNYYIKTQDILDQVYSYETVHSFGNWHYVSPDQAMEPELEKLLLSIDREKYLSLIFPEDEYVDFVGNVLEDGFLDRIKSLKKHNFSPQMIGELICENLSATSDYWGDASPSMQTIDGISLYYGHLIREFDLGDRLCEWSSRSIEEEMELYIEQSENYCALDEGDGYGLLYYNPQDMKDKPEKYFDNLDEFVCGGSGGPVLEELFLLREDSSWEEDLEGMVISSASTTDSVDYDYVQTKNYQLNGAYFHISVKYSEFCELSDAVFAIKHGINNILKRKSKKHNLITFVSGGDTCRYKIVGSHVPSVRLSGADKFSPQSFRAWLESL